MSGETDQCTVSLYLPLSTHQVSGGYQLDGISQRSFLSNFSQQEYGIF